MKETLKIEFIDDDSFTAYYITDDEFEDEDDYKIMVKYIDNELKRKYNYSLHGFYDVNIYVNKGIYIADFIFIDDYGRKDFNVSIFLKSKILYCFEDNDLISGKKMYYDGYFYIDIDRMLNDIRLYEYGSIVYGKDVELIINNSKEVI